MRPDKEKQAEAAAKKLLGRNYAFPGESLAEQYQAAVREARDLARLTLKVVRDG